MSLPTTRDFNIIPGVTPVPGNLLNTLQDCIIGNKKPSMVRGSLPNLWLPGANWAPAVGGYLSCTGVAGAIIAPPAMEEADRITQVVIASFGTGAATVTHVIAYQTAALSVVTLATATDVNRAAAWGDFTINPTAHVMGVGEVLYHSIASTVTGPRLSNARYKYDRL